MSGEFGSYNSGFFHQQIETAATDCLGGEAQITRLVGSLLAELAPVAEGISWCEASDTGEDYPVLQLVQALPGLRKAFRAIENYAAPFVAVAEAAKRQAVEKHLKDSKVRS